MKLKLDVECTPEEARAFMGLPDVAPMQERLMRDMENRLRDNINSLDPETLIKTWMPMTLQNWAEMQKAFWDQIRRSTGSDEKGKK